MLAPLPFLPVTNTVRTATSGLKRDEESGRLGSEGLFAERIDERLPYIVSAACPRLKKFAYPYPDPPALVLCNSQSAQLRGSSLLPQDSGYVPKEDQEKADNAPDVLGDLAKNLFGKKE